MQLQSLVVAAVAAVVGIFAGRATHSEIETHIVAPSCPAPPVHVAPALPAVAAPEHVEEVDDSIDLGEALVHAEQHDAEAQRRRDAIVGTVRDARTGERLAGVTIVMTSPAMGTTQSAISDEHGDYAAYGLAPGLYNLTFYYADVTTMHADVAVSDYGPTPLDDSIDTAPPPPAPARTFESVTFSSQDTVENEYIVDDP